VTDIETVEVSNMIRGAVILISMLLVSIVGAVAQSSSPYAGQEKRAVKALSEAELRDLTEGRGMGLAKAAELNSYPGPAHVLELASELGLSDAQRTASESLVAPMRERAIALGRQIIEAERDLDHAFADRSIDHDYLRRQVAKIAALTGELRAVHLETHLAQRAILTPDQIARYDALRGYQASAAQPGHRMHGH
jgi:Spy/CpxP family protein refolding chaperone